MPESKAEEQRLLVEFMTAYRTDQELDGLRPLAHYLRRYPGYEEAIAREYFVLRAIDEGAKAPKENAQTSPDSRSTLGHYQLQSELGRGGQGAVYLAEDLTLGRRVALKVFHRHVETGAERGRLRFLREAAAGSRLDHPGICNIYETGRADGVPYIAMRYVEGESLAELLQRAKAGHVKLSCWSAVKSIEKVARALHAAHEVGIVHRDIKPENIILQDEQTPVIVDFGLAQDDSSALERLTLSGDLIGTPAYMAPEQLRADHDRIDRRCDVWSLGVVLYECLSLERPFRAPTRDGLCQAILHKELSHAPRKLPRDLQIILHTALAKEPGRRYRTTLDFAEDLRRAASHEPILARRPRRIYRIYRWAQRNPLAAAGLLFSVLSLTLGLAVALWLLSREGEQRRRAEARFEDVHQLSSTLIFDIGRKLKDTPGTTRVQQKLASIARDYLERLQGDPDLRPSVRISLISSWIALADVSGHPGTGNLGNHAEALRSYVRAEYLARNLLRDDPANREVRGLLATSLTRLGDTHQLQGRTAEGKQALEEAATLFAQLDSEGPLTVPQRALFASAQAHIAMLAETRGDLARALSWASLAESRFGALAEEHPEDHELAGNWASIRVLIGRLHDRQESFDTSKAIYRQIVKDLEPFADEHTRSRGILSNLALARRHYSESLFRENELEPARKELDEALRLRRALQLADPDDVSARRQLCLVLLDHGYLLEQMGEHDPAEKDLIEALEHARFLHKQERGHGLIQRALIRSLMALGRFHASRDVAYARELLAEAQRWIETIRRQDPRNSLVPPMLEACRQLLDQVNR